MRNIKLTIEYDGTNYAGWQVQPNGTTIQQALEQAIAEIVQHEVSLTGSGRTDTGVHALGQVANFHTESEIPAERLVHAINSRLPDDIAIVAAEDAPAGFHARYSAKSKTYRYRVLNRRVRSPMMRNTAYLLQEAIELDKMKEAAECLAGRHDFAAFRTAGSAARTTVRNVMRLDIETTPRQDGLLIDFYITADGFLYNMVRAIVGTLLDVGRGRFDAGDVKRILESKDRSLAGPTAPAHGLCLMEVHY